METPEKVYVTESMIFATNPEITLPKNDKIEYTRTDAFVEKASEWLKDNADSYLIERTYHFPYHLDKEFLKDDLVSDFKKAMEGE